MVHTYFNQVIGRFFNTDQFRLHPLLSKTIYLLLLLCLSSSCALDQEDYPINTKVEFIQAVTTLDTYIARNCAIFTEEVIPGVKAVYATLMEKERPLYSHFSKEEKIIIENCMQQYEACFGTSNQ
ncbi:MAG: hypothetical protein AAGI23_15960 [Bacteroidota bacterium]